ncbi:MAG TPA: zinc-binding dehydrogenase [Streptosporangiaceae bacterium]|nr:zinc-binding dehydrogenase [Streptosporangiaceae bacterium]
MRAIISTPGGPGRVALTAGVPEPAPAPDEALVAVEAFSLNPGELALLAARPAGWRPGQDIAGTVVTPAADGSGPAAGTRVAAVVEGAGWAERAAVPVHALAVLPAGVEMAAAATLGIAGRTALRTVALGGSLLGRRILVTAAGAVGRFQIQLAALAGAEVVAVSRRPDAAPELLDHGAAEVAATVGDAAGLFDLVLDDVGGRTLAAAVSKVAPGGTVVLIGVADPEPAQLTLTDFFGHENAVIRSYFSYAQPGASGDDLATLAGLLAGGRLRPPIGLHASWDQTSDFLDALANGKVDGKAVLDIR